MVVFISAGGVFNSILTSHQSIIKILGILIAIAIFFGLIKTLLSGPKKD